MATFILIAGASHGAWCWERVTPILQAAGHTVAAPDLLGMGSDATPLDRVSLAAWADQIAAIISKRDERVVVVGHSRAGIIMSEAAERIPDRISRLIYLSALLVPDGMAVSDLQPSLQGDALPPFAMAGEPGTSLLRPDTLGPVFYGTSDLEWVRRAADRVGPEPLAPMKTRLRLSKERYGRVPRAYIECLRDCVLPLAVQRAMQRSLPCDPVAQLDTDHSPFYSAPEALAAILRAPAWSAP